MTKKDEDRKGKRQKKSEEKEGKQIEWAFKPTLGQKVEPKLTQEEFEKVLTRLSVPTQEKSDQEKRETSA